MTSVIPSNMPPRAIAVGSPVPISGAGTARQADEVKHGLTVLVVAACAPALAINTTEQMAAANHFMLTPPCPRFMTLLKIQQPLGCDISAVPKSRGNSTYSPLHVRDRVLPAGRHRGRMPGSSSALSEMPDEIAPLSHGTIPLRFSGDGVERRQLTSPLILPYRLGPNIRVIRCKVAGERHSD
jgi:hypothetical protein